MLRKFIAWTGITGGFAFLVIWVAAIAGWFMNLFKLVELVLTASEFTPLLAARIVGVPFSPLGAVLGWF